MFPTDAVHIGYRVKKKIILNEILKHFHILKHVRMLLKTMYGMRKISNYLSLSKVYQKNMIKP
jgi:hypothetical protein